MEDIPGLIERIEADIQNEKSEAEIFQSLLPHLGRDAKFDGQMAESLAMIPHVKIAKILQKMLQVSNDKKVQKTIKRSLYRLKGKGIAMEEVHLRKEASILQPLKREPSRGFGNGYDMAWNRFLVLSIPHAGRGLTVLHGLISDTEGLLNFSGGEISRKEFKGFFEEVQKASPTPLVEIEPSYVGFLFDQAYQLRLNKGGVPSQDYLHLKGEVEGVKQEYAKPFIYGLLQAEEIAGDDRVLTRGGELLKADLFHGWRIEENLIRPFADEVWEAEESKIVLNQAQKEARFQGIYQKALSELFSGERRLQYKRRLEEMAYLLFQLKKEEEARVSLAVAVDLEKPLNLIQPNPFLFQLVVKSIFSVLTEAYEKRAKELSLIVKP